MIRLLPVRRKVQRLQENRVATTQIPSETEIFLQENKHYQCLTDDRLSSPHKSYSRDHMEHGESSHACEWMCLCHDTSLPKRGSLSSVAPTKWVQRHHACFLTTNIRRCQSDTGFLTLTGSSTIKSLYHCTIQKMNYETAAHGKSGL
jgi:hypothetical protein